MVNFCGGNEASLSSAGLMNMFGAVRQLLVCRAVRLANLSDGSRASYIKLISMLGSARMLGSVGSVWIVNSCSGDGAFLTGLIIMDGPARLLVGALLEVPFRMVLLLVSPGRLLVVVDC